MAEKEPVDQQESSANAGNAAKPPRLRLPLANVEDVRRELARLYRQMKARQVDSADGARLANALQILARLIETSELERRLEDLEQAQRGKR